MNLKNMYTAVHEITMDGEERLKVKRNYFR